MFLSIIIPVYNAAQTIFRCLESIWRQDLPQDEYEVICVDDCSPDNSLEVLQTIQQKHSNLRIERHTQNLRAGGARNTGVRVAQGEYILFIDADDYFHPESLKIAVDCLQKNTDLDILTCNFARELQNFPNDSFVHFYTSEAKLLPKQYIQKNHIPCGPCQWFFRKTLMTENNIWFRNHTISEDVDWTHRLILRAKVIQYQPILLSHYVIDKGTQTALSYAKSANVYAYMNAGKALYQLRELYAVIGHEEYITGMARGYIQQGMKYYLAMSDCMNEKIRNLRETIPAGLVLSGYWEQFRRHPYLYASFSNFVCPMVRLMLKIKARYSFRGIKVKK